MAFKSTLSGSESLKRKFAAQQEAVSGRMVERGLVAASLPVQNDAKRNAPYVTGNLRRSLHIGGHEDLNTDGGAVQHSLLGPVPPPEITANGAAVYTGTDVEYAAPVEFGAEGRGAQPYLRPALDTNHGTIRREFGEAMRDLIRAAA